MTQYVNVWNKFWNWYENKILGSIIIIAIIQFIQIPHMVWNANMMLEAGTISRVHPVLDWFLYGVDLIEIISIINVGMIMFSLIKKAKNQPYFVVQPILWLCKCGKGVFQVSRHIFPSSFTGFTFNSIFIMISIASSTNATIIYISWTFMFNTFIHTITIPNTLYKSIR